MNSENISKHSERKNLSQKQFFLISFLPAIAYWYLEAHYSLKVALLGGILLGILEILFEKFYTKHIHALSKFNFFLILFLGAISFGEEDGLWFKLQPTFTGVGIGSYLFLRLYKGKSLMHEMILSMGKILPKEDFLKTIEIHFACFFFIYGLFMAFVTLHLSTSKWLFFKTAGFYIASFLFFIFEILYMRFFLLKKKKESYSHF